MLRNQYPISIRATQRRGGGHHSTFGKVRPLQNDRNDSRRDLPETAKHRNGHWTVSWKSVRRLSLKGNAAEMRKMYVKIYLLDELGLVLFDLLAGEFVKLGEHRVSTRPEVRFDLFAAVQGVVDGLSAGQNRVELGHGCRSTVPLYAKTTFKSCQ
jgi:hypothetical protein